MQRLDHDTVRRMIAEREATAAHVRLTRSLSRTLSHTTPRTSPRRSRQLLEVLSNALVRSVVSLRPDLRASREGHLAPSGPPMRSATRRPVAPVGCV
jgi:hypothetical protein